jgi:hypothetical protein
VRGIQEVVMARFDFSTETTSDSARPTPARPGGPPKRWEDKVEKLTIGSLDKPKLPCVVAQYNPKELQFDKQLQWQKPERLAGGQQNADDQDEVELPAKPTRSVTIELLFDGFEEHRSVQPEIDQLEVLSSIRVPGSRFAPLRRPHHCVVTWGTKGTRPFRCVIESLSIKLTMFAPSGAPLRAICSVKLTEVNVLEKMDEPGE